MRIYKYRCSLPTSVQWQFSGIPPPPQLLTPNLFIPYQGWGSSLGSGHIPGSEPSPRTASQNMLTICYLIKCKGELVNSMSNEKCIFHSSISLPVKYVVWVGLRIMCLKSLIQLTSVLVLLQSMVQVSATDYHWCTISVGLYGLCSCRNINVGKADGSLNR